MATEAVTRWYREPRLPGEWIEDGVPLPGWEASGFLLSWAALDSWATHVSTGEPCETLIVGEVSREVRGEKRTWLLEAQNARWIERSTDWRLLDGRWVWFCPECSRSGGKDHERACSRG